MPIADDKRSFSALPETDQQFLLALHQRAVAALAMVVETHGKRPGLATALGEARVALLDTELAPVGPAMAAARTPVACSKGCCSCCTLTVEVTPDEVLALVDWLGRQLTAAQLQAVKERAIAHDRIGHGVPALDRHALRLNCPVLDPASGACLGHAVRPIPCQSYFSLDRRRCEADHLGPAVPIPQPVAADYIRDTVMAARAVVVDAAGLSRRQLELTAALAAVWQDEDTERRWLAGEPVLAEVPGV